MKRSFWIVFSLLLLAGAWYFWPAGGRSSAPVKPAALPAAAAASTPVALAGTNHAPLLAARNITPLEMGTNREAFLLTNTTKTIGQLTTRPHAILLENALLDTDAKLALKIPTSLRAKGEPGAYVIQAKGLVDDAFRAALAAAGAQMVCYIPNNAYLVQASAAEANLLSSSPLVQAVLPFDPYFKIQSSLLGLAVEQQPLPAGQVLTLGLYARGAQATVAQIESLGGRIIGTDRSPFGPVVRVLPATDWLALAQLPGVQCVEPATKRQVANDLARVTMGISTDTVTNANWLNLSGSNVLVEVNDTGIDPAHPDFGLTTNSGSPSRVIGYSPTSLFDVDGHGTHVAGVIAGNGAESGTVTNTPSGSVTNANYRGKAPAADLFSFGFLGANDTNVYYSDQLLQEIPALTNALISNNSWVNGGDNTYDLSAASYDAAVRDALPGTTGPQPVLFVFAAGNQGGGDDSGFNGSSDTILSPGTAKNVITVGALDQYRGLTNTYTPLATTNEVLAWAGETSSSNLVAWYSSRGNVGVGTEGAYGRFKPDVVAPGAFVVSTRPSMWDMNAYFNPTNYHATTTAGYVDTNTLMYGVVSVPTNAVGVNILIQPNASSPVPFPTNLPIYLSLNGVPSATNYDYAGSNSISIPPAYGDITPLINLNFTYAVGDSTNFPVSFNVLVQVITTNDYGNLLTVQSNLDQTLSPWYYYESGTSIAAPAVSGTLALMQDFFTNTLQTTPSPALLKAMLINGARLTSGYNNYAVTNGLNYEGWGLVNLPNSIPLGLTNLAPSAPQGLTNNPMFFLDQSPTNALATGDSRTYLVNVPTLEAQINPMHITLAWTDPPGNPVAGIKLVNDLDLIVTNLDTGAVYFGNTFGDGNTAYSIPVDSNSVPDSINNVESVVLPPLLGTNYSVTVYGRNVAVNAVTAEQTNIVQDFALVISCGDGGNTNGIIVTPAPAPAFSTSVIAPNVTFVTSYTNGIYFNQLVGSSAPWLSTNTLSFGTNSPYGTNSSLSVGQTNQWHFYVVTNTTVYTNAAFITFLPDTQATPRMGVFADNTLNSTRPEADLNLFVAPEDSSPAYGDPNAGNLTNLDMGIISNCVYGVNNAQASLDRGGTKFVAYTNSQGQQVYYVGVQSQDQTAGQYGFLAVFSEQPFSEPNANGQTVNGLMLPANIPDGSNARGGVAYVFGLAIYPMQVAAVTVTNIISHQNYGDLVGSLTHGGDGVVLNNHDGLGDVTDYMQAYNDNGLPGTTAADGPGSLRSFSGSEGIGPWLFTEVDDSLGNTGSINGFTLEIQKHRNLKDGFTVVIPPLSWFYDYIDVPVGYTNLTVAATNITQPSPSPLVTLYLNYGVEPDFTNYLDAAGLTNTISTNAFLYGSVSNGPPLAPGRYFIGIYNGSTDPQTISGQAFLAFDASAISYVNYDSPNPVPLLDDAVTDDYQYVTNNDIIQGISVGLRVDHPRISDLSFTLISPQGTRYLLMENRGGQTTNGCGATVVTTNIFSSYASGGADGATNSYNLNQISGSIPLTWNFYTVPDQMDVYYGQTADPANLIFSTGVTNGQDAIEVPFGPTNGLTSTYITVVMDATNHPLGTLWNYTVGGVQTNYEYLSFTEDTNLTMTPIKYAVPPFIPPTPGTVWSNGFEADTVGVKTAPATLTSGWSVLTNQVEVAASLPASDGVKYLQLDNGAVSYALPTTPGRKYVLTYQVGTTLTDINQPLTNANWQAASISFTGAAGTNGTLLVLDASGGGFNANSIITNNFNTNTLLDDFVLTELPGNLYYLPEQDISDLVGTPANGTGYVGDSGRWTLEVLDNRAGATNNASLLSWQLAFTFANTNLPAGPVVVTPGQPQTNVIAPNSVVWYAVNVPTNADFATNTLIFATAPLNLLFNQTTADTNGSTVLLSNVTSGTNVLSAGSTPSLVPGATYYLGLQNTNSTFVTNAFEVDFHLKPTTVPPIDFSSIVYTNGGYLLTWFAPTDDVFQVQWSDTLSPLIWQNFTNIITYQGPTTTNFGMFTFFDDGSQTGGFLPGIRFYNLVLLGSLSGITPGVPQTNTVPANSIAYYEISVPASADRATNNLLTANAPVNLLFNQTTPPAGTNAGDFLLLTNVTSGISVLSASSTPALVPGTTYYLGVQNTNSFPVTFALEVNFHLATLTFPSIYPISGIVLTNGSDFLLSWLAPTNDIFEVQVATNLASPIPWQTLATNITYAGPLTPTNGWFSYLDSSTNTAVPFGPIRFYQLLLTGVQTPAISGFTFTTNGLNLTWSAPTNDQFQVAWATNLVPPIAWTPFPGIITSTNGIFSFTDTNTPSLMKFYELILLP